MKFSLQLYVLPRLLQIFPCFIEYQMIDLKYFKMSLERRDDCAVHSMARLNRKLSITKTVSVMTDHFPIYLRYIRSLIYHRARNFASLKSHHNTTKQSEDRRYKYKKTREWGPNKSPWARRRRRRV